MKKILHIASFKGNVGDIINHKGFYNILREVIGDFTVNQVELRNFYRSANPRFYFDEHYADFVNTYDLLVIGGGGFFDVRWDNSSNGTTLDFSENFVDRVKIPALINAMGYHEYPGVTNECQCAKFADFLKKTSTKDNWIVSVRNDGSYERLDKRYGKFPFMEKIIKVADNGFYAGIKHTDSRFVLEGKTIGFCITNDLFCDEYNHGIDTDLFNTNIAKLIETLIEEGNRIILFPHIPSDLTIIQRLLHQIADKYKRESIIVGPYTSSDSLSPDLVAQYYSMCDTFVGMRFHSLILAYQLGIPAIALCGHAQIEALYKDIGYESMAVVVNSSDFINELRHKIEIIRVKDVDYQKTRENADLYLQSLKEKYSKLLMQNY